MRIRLAGVIGLTAIVSLAGAGLTGLTAASARVIHCPTVNQATGAVTPAPAPGVDWSGCDLDNAIMVNADLAGANLSGASLTGESRQENLSGTNFTGAKLSHALMDGANLSGAKLTNANMTSANLLDAVLAGVSLGGANLTGADLTNVESGKNGGITGSPAALPPNWKITGGFLIGPTASLELADLHGLDLSGADLAAASLDQADLTATDLSQANLVRAQIFDANLSGANLTGADASDADLSQANVSGASLSGTVLAGAVLGLVSSGGITGTPASLPTDWTLADGYLIGPDDALKDASLAGADLTGADLNFTDLAGADLAGANLANANLTQATVAGANLAGTNLATARLADISSGGITGTPILPASWTAKFGFLIGPQTDLAGASLSGDDLSGVDLSAAFLQGANLSSANLAGASMTSADLNFTNLTSANFSGSDLTGSGLFRTDVSGTNFGTAVLDKVRGRELVGHPASLPADWLLFQGFLIGPGANLDAADLAGANLAGVNFSGATLDDADLTNTNLVDANLSNASVDATLDGTDLTGATVTGANFTGAAWLNATCPDGSNSNKYVDGCFSALDKTPPAAAPAVTSGTPGTNGWYVTPVVVTWNWTDDGTIVLSTCQQLTSTAALGPTTLRAACTDLAGNVGHARFLVKVDYSLPVVTVRGVASGSRYVIGKVPAAGCATREPYSGIAVRATPKVTTTGSNGVGFFAATCSGAVSVAGLRASPVRAFYLVGYGFGGFAGLRPGSQVSKSARRLTVRFRLTNAAGHPISAGRAAALAAGRGIEVTLTGPGIKAVTALCRWIASAGRFGCTLRIPAGVESGSRFRYELTARERPGPRFFTVPATGSAANPLTIGFTSR